MGFGAISNKRQIFISGSTKANPVIANEKWSKIVELSVGNTLG